MVLVTIVPVGLALLPDQSAVSRTAWVLLSLTVATAFGAIGERRRRQRLLMRNAFALAIVAFGVLAGLMIRESAPVTFAAITSDESATLSRESTTEPEAGVPEASVQGATASAEDELADCEAALRRVEQAIRPVTVPTTPTAVAGPDGRTVAERRQACADLVAVLDAAVRQSGALAHNETPDADR